jgi:hypothetical protein
VATVTEAKNTLAKLEAGLVTATHRATRLQEERRRVAFAAHWATRPRSIRSTT